MDDQGQTNPTQGDQGGMTSTPEPTTPAGDQGGMGGGTPAPEAPAHGEEAPTTGGEEQTPPAQPSM